MMTSLSMRMLLDLHAAANNVQTVPRLDVGTVRGDEFSRISDIPEGLHPMASRAQPVLWRETVKAGAVRSGALVAAIALFAVTLMLVLALASYRASDPALNTASGAAPANWMGLPGA
jgi:hypothetical protein